MDLVKAGKSPKPVYLIYALMVFLGFFTTKFVFNNFIDKKIEVQPKVIEPVVIEPVWEETPISPPALEPQLEESVVEVALPEKKLPPSFSLNGIFFDEAQPYALINNEVVKQGDNIQGAKVVRILVGEVDLEWEGESIELKIPR